MNYRLLFFYLGFLVGNFQGYAQFYVSQNTFVHLESYQILLSSQERFNQLNAQFTGEGTLILNAAAAQILSSTQKKLVLPTLQLANANLVQINTNLNIQQLLKIEIGILTLTHRLVLKNKNALVLSEDIGILITTGQLVYNTQLENSNPLAITLTNFLKYRVPSIPQARPTVAYRHISHFGNLVSKDHPAYLKNSTPPPKFFDSVS